MKRITKDNVTGAGKFCLFENQKMVQGRGKNIFSVSYFVLENGYKAQVHYYNGLKRLADIIAKVQTVNKILLRVYYDRSVEKYGDEGAKWTMKYLKTQPHVELVYVDCGELISLEQSGFLSAILRYLPFFDYDNNDIDYLWVQDIDVFDVKNYESRVTVNIKEFDDVISSKIQLHFTQPNCYTPLWLKDIDGPDNAILGTYISGNIKMPLSLLVNFINAFLNNTDPLVQNYKKNYIAHASRLVREDPGGYKGLLATCKPGSCIFSFGFDEFFILLYMYPWCLKHGHRVRVKTSHLYGGLRMLLNMTFRPGKSADRMVRNFGKLIDNRDIERMNFRSFADSFKPHDFEGVTNKDAIWEKFYNYIMGNLRQYRPIMNQSALKCFAANKVYLTIHNRLHIYTDEERAEIYRNFGKINRIFAE